MGRVPPRALNGPAVLKVLVTDLMYQTRLHHRVKAFADVQYEGDQYKPKPASVERDQS